jgi:hypothetical protein
MTNVKALDRAREELWDESGIIARDIFGPLELIERNLSSHYSHHDSHHHKHCCRHGNCHHRHRQKLHLTCRGLIKDHSPQHHCSRTQVMDREPLIKVGQSWRDSKDRISLIFANLQVRLQDKAKRKKINNSDQSTVAKAKEVAQPATYNIVFFYLLITNRVLQSDVSAPELTKCMELAMKLNREILEQFQKFESIIHQEVDYMGKHDERLIDDMDMSHGSCDSHDGCCH